MKLICMAFDGEYVVDKESNSIEELQERSTNMGSTWIFYPFHFICTEKRIIKAGVQHLKNKTITEVQKHFKNLSEQPKMKNCSVEDFLFELNKCKIKH